MIQIQKQSVSMNFSKGLDLKTDPWQVPLGNFLELVNSVFDEGGLLKKRNGFGPLSTLPSSDYSYLTTFSGNLTALGPDVAALNAANESWVTSGPIAPMSVSTLPLIRNGVGQTQADSVVAPNGLVCSVYTQSSNGTVSYVYAIADSVTGQNVTPPLAIPVSSGTVTGSPRVFLLGNYFVLMFTNVISATAHLQYIVIPTSNPQSVSDNLDLASSYIPAATLSWDGCVSGTQLFVAYNTTAGGQRVAVTYLDTVAAASAFTLSPISPPTPTTFAAEIATVMSVTVDETVANPAVYLSYYDLASTTGFVASVDTSLIVLEAPQQIISTGTILNLASSAAAGILTVFYEVSNNYGYDSAIPTHYVSAITVTGATVGAPYIVARSIGLASKAFLVSGTIYFLAAYQSPFQPTYFLVNGSSSTEAHPLVVGKLAYENGGGYSATGLPGVTVSGATAQMAYLVKDLIEAQAPAGFQSINLKAPAVYTQTGINLGSFSFGGGIDTAETGSNLHFSGGFFWMYDGYRPVEHNFFLWPDSVEASISTSTITVTGTVTSGSAVVTAVSSTAGLGLGMTLTGTAIPAATTIVSFTSTTITMSAAATGTHSGESIAITGNIGPQPDSATNTNAYYYQAIYEFTDNQGNVHRSAPSIPLAITTTGTGTTGTYIFTVKVPTLRLTYKILNKVKIRLYRWSVAKPVYYEVTSITYPTLNDPTVDYVTIVDALNDSSIVGNSIIYTTGGVVGNVNAPATNVMTLFDTRLWMIDAEDPNLFWFSKQVVENVPVEMSDLFTYFVPPATAAQGPTGPMRACAPMDDKLIVFKENAIYYINGTGPDNTGSNSQYSQPIFVTSVVGCSNQQSIVFTPAGLMFQSSKGIWLLGRDLSTSYIGSPVEDFNGSTVQSAVDVPKTNQVRFTLDTGETLMYDYFYGQWGIFEGAPAISSCIYRGLHTIINSFGKAEQETPGLYLDGYNPVLLKFRTSWIQLAALQGYQRFYSFFFLGKYYSPHRLNVEIAYNFIDSTVHSSLIRPKNFSAKTPSPRGDQPSPYGSPTSLEQWKIHAKIQKCQSFQITLTEIFDASFGVPPGPGLTLSGLNLTLAVKKGVRPIRASNTVG